MAQLALANVINVSISEAQTGLGEYNTSNLAIFTSDDPVASWTEKFRIYKQATDVATDFGTSSRTAKMATNVFAQSPNILTGNGSLIVIPLLKNISAVTAVQKLSFDSVPTVGSYKLGFGGNYTTALAFNADAAAVQVALRLLTGLGSVTVTGDTTAGFVVTLAGVSGPAALITISENSLQNASGFDVFITASTTTVGVAAQAEETLADAITRTQGLVQYFGVLASTETTDANVQAAAAIIQTLKKIAFFPKRLVTDVQDGGIADLITTAKQDRTRILLYLTSPSTDEASVLFSAAYAGRALSVDFSGSNTASTMHLKDLTNVDVDDGITQTILNNCTTYGADVYASIQGVAKVFTSGANNFFDQVYNKLWEVGALEIDGFNYLATTSTKIPQTESGMDGLKAAYRAALEQGITNGYIAAGTWTSPDTFGVKEDFERNIKERGYYIYSTPLSKQSATDRAARKAALIQIAYKEAGAIHSSNVIVNINP